MIIVRDRHARGHTEIGWLDSRHTFSFGDYRHPELVGLREGDSAKIEGQCGIELDTDHRPEILLFNLK